MKKLSLLLCFAFIFFSTQAQNLQISEDPSTRNNNTSQFNLEYGQVTVNGSSVPYAQNAVSADVAPSGLSATVGEGGISIYESDGTELIKADYEMIDNDNSLKIYAAGNGEVIVRENIANFLIYDSFGNLQHSISNSSQSTEGESISELAADPAFRTLVLYNPKIIRGGEEGSRARIAERDGEMVDIFNSSSRAIRFVNVSDNGRFIGVATFKSGTDDEALIFDRFGNELNTFSFDQNISDIKISDDGRYVTLRSNSRVAAFEMLSGESVGGTSFRNTLHFAEYIPADQVYVALTADKSGNNLTNVEIHVINVAARSIERQEYNGSLGTTDLLPVSLSRKGKYTYTLTGLNQNLNISVSF